MNVLIDYHHSDLMESLYRLFEDRLGMTVYAPRGMEWRDAGYWRFGQGYPDGGEGVGRQFLLAAERDELQPQREIHWLTLEEGREMDFAVVLCSVPDNYAGYARFAAEKGARLVIQAGNVNQPIDWSLEAVLLDATGVFDGVPFTPEFDIDGAYRYSKPSGMRSVASFVNLFPKLPCYGEYLETMEWLHDWHGAIYGHSGDEFLKSPPIIGSRMAVNDFGWHDKVTGDGFGYVIHYWASVGRPLIGHGHHYAGQLAEFMWDDLVTCIDLDKHSPQETATLMESIVKTDRLEEMGAILAERVRERIDFAADAERVADALGLLVPA